MQGGPSFRDTHHHRQHFRRRRPPRGAGAHRGRMGALHPRLESRRLRRAQRRQLLRQPAGRSRPRYAAQLRRDRRPERRRRPHRDRHARPHARGAAAVRAQGDRNRRRGSLGARLPAAEEAPHGRVPAHDPAPAPAHQPVQRRVSRALGGGLRRARVLPDPRVRLCEHAHHHRLRLRGRRRDVPRHRARHGERPAHRRRRGRLQPGLLRQGGQPHRVGPAAGRKLRHGVRQRIHLRPHVPR